MTLKVEIRDGGLRVQRPAASRLQAKVGVSSAGNLNEVLRLRDPSDIAATFGTGPLVDALGDAFAAGAQDLLAVRATADVAGTLSAVTAQKTGTGTLAVAGDPLDAYQVTVEILSAGTLNGATFKYSLDGGDTWSGRQTVPAGGQFQIPGTGLTLTFAAGVPAEDSFQVGDLFSFTSTAPAASVASLGTALDALLATTLEFDLVHIVGPTAAAVWAVLASRAATAAGGGRYFHFVAETRGPADAETAAAWAQAVAQEANGFSDTRVALVAGRAELTDYITGRLVDRNIAGLYTGRLAAIPEQTSPAAVSLGALPMCQSVNPAGLTVADLATLDDAHLVTARTILGLSGLYVVEGHMQAPEDSDYQTVELRRIMDKACRLVRRAALRYDHAEGTPEGIAALQAQLSAPLENEMAGQILAGQVVIPDQDLAGTSTLVVRIRITPIPIMREITLDIGFENPLQEV